MSTVPTPPSDPLDGDPYDDLEPHPDPDDWTDLQVRLARAAGLRWGEADAKLQTLGRPKAETLCIRLATDRPDWSPQNDSTGESHE